MTFALAAIDALSVTPRGEPLALLHLHLHLFEHVQQWMRTAGYPVLFGLLFSCGLGLPLPEDVPLLFAGYFVATGEMSLLPAAVTAWLGIVGGDCILYSIGRRYGMAITSVPVIGSHIKTEQIGKLHLQFEKYGVWVVAVGRMFAGVRGAMVLVAGTIRFTFSHFIVADGLAAVVSGGVFMGLGYYAGHRFGDLKQIHEAIEQYSLRILLFLAIVGLGVGAWLYWRPRKGTAEAPPGAAAEQPTPPVVTAAATESPALPRA